MKHLFLARHGEYDEDYRLNPAGEAQIKDLAVAIQEVRIGSLYIISSTAPRALDSAELLSSELDLGRIEPLDFLWTGDGPKFNMEKHSYNKWGPRLMQIINEREEVADPDGLIIMTHYEVTEFLPRYFSKNVFGQETSIRDPVEKGNAYHFDLEKKTIEEIPK